MFSHPTAMNSLRRSEAGFQRFTRDASWAVRGTDIHVGPALAVCGVHRLPGSSGHWNSGSGGENATVIRPSSLQPMLCSWLVMWCPMLVALSVVIGLSLNSAAFLAEIFRAGIQSIERGQYEAARSLGWSLSTLRRRLDRADRLLLGFWGIVFLLIEFFPNGFTFDRYYTVPRIFRYLAPISFPVALHAAKLLLDVTRGWGPAWTATAAGWRSGCSIPIASS